MGLGQPESRGGVAQHNAESASDLTRSAGHWAGRGGSCLAQLATRPSHIDCGPIGTRAVSGLRGARAKSKQAPEGATGSGVGLDSKGVAGLNWTGGEVRSLSDHADIGMVE